MQRDVLTDARRPLEDSQRNCKFISNAAARHDLQRVEILRDELALDPRDHGIVRSRIGWIRGRSGIIAKASAAATPSAASLGCGADFSRSRRVTMNWICSLVAAPVPATAFLISDGGYSWISRPACAPARRITPRACPSTTVVLTLRA